MKPNTQRCMRYCDLYDECKRTNCSRKLVLYADSDNKMEEKNVYNRYRIPEKKRAYFEGRVVKTNF